MSSLPQIGQLCVVLVETRNPLNIGAAARALTNFGVSDLRVVNPYSTAFRRAKSAVGAAELLARAKKFKSVADAVADCSLVVGTTAVRHRTIQHPLRRLEQGAKVIRKKLEKGRVAILFGSEKFGLSNEHMGLCHWLMRIPTSDTNISMNLGQAVAVCLYELIRDGKAVLPIAHDPEANGEEVERLSQMLLQALDLGNYIKPGMASADDRVRRLVRRLKLSSDDASVLQGMLRKIIWKLNH